jgi:hypothetical protein
MFSRFPQCSPGDPITRAESPGQRNVELTPYRARHWKREGIYNMADSGKLGYVGEEIRREVAEAVGILLKNYFTESLADLARDIEVDRVEHERALAEYSEACETLQDEAKRRGVNLEPSLPAATACRRKKAKGATGPRKRRP